MISMEKDMNITNEILELAVKRQPDRYIVTRDGKDNLVEVIDQDTGIVLQKLPNGWVWVI